MWPSIHVTKEAAISRQGKCGCRRSLTGFCAGVMLIGIRENPGCSGVHIGKGKRVDGPKGLIRRENG